MDPRIRSLFIVHASMLIMALGSSIIFTGVWPYLQQMDPLVTLEEYGFVVAADALGQMIFSPLFGFLADKMNRVRVVILICAATFVCGNVMYSLISLVPREVGGLVKPRVWAMFAARFVVGIGTAITAAARAYASKVTTLEERTTHVAMLSLFQTLGFILGPACQAALSPIGKRPVGADSQFSFNMYTATGFFSCLNGIIVFILFLPGVFEEFQSPPAAIKEEEEMEDQPETTNKPISSVVNKRKAFIKQYSTLSLRDGASQEVRPKVAAEPASAATAKRPDFICVSALTYAFFSYYISFVLMETLASPIAIDQWSWEPEDALLYLGIIQAGGGLLAGICFGTIGPLAKRFNEKLLLIFCGIIPLMIGRSITIPMGNSYPEFIGNKTECEGYEVEDGSASDDATQLYSSSSSDSKAGFPGCHYCWCLSVPQMAIPQFLVGFTLSTMAFPFCVAITGSVFSKVLGRARQGAYMGVLVVASSSARVIGPLLFTLLYEKFGLYVLFGTLLSVLLPSLAVIVLLYKRLVAPADEEGGGDVSGGGGGEAVTVAGGKSRAGAGGKARTGPATGAGAG